MIEIVENQDRADYQGRQRKLIVLRSADPLLLYVLAQTFRAMGPIDCSATPIRERDCDWLENHAIERSPNNDQYIVWTWAP